MLAVNRGAAVTYGLEHERADVRAREIRTALGGGAFTAETPRGRIPITLRHLGDYSIYNALAAVAVGEALGVPLEQIAAGLAGAPPVPGRFELVDAGQEFVVAVDYAHKPDALRRLLESARRLEPRRLVVVFGCGGDRDRTKRPVMGRIAAELSDYVVVTSDNPRSEAPAAIVEEILAGVRSAAPRARWVAEVDRARAICHAIDVAEAEDIVLIAGKGHEDYQILGERKIHFSDVEEAAAALSASPVLN